MDKYIIKDVMDFCDFKFIFEVCISLELWWIDDNHVVEPSIPLYIIEKET